MFSLLCVLVGFIRIYVYMHNLYLRTMLYVCNIPYMHVYLYAYVTMYVCMCIITYLKCFHYSECQESLIHVIQETNCTA